MLYFPYDAVISVFDTAGRDICFDESIPDHTFQAAITAIEALDSNARNTLQGALQQEEALADTSSAIDFINQYDAAHGTGAFRKYEIIVRCTNGTPLMRCFHKIGSAPGVLAYVSSSRGAPPA